MILLVIAGNSNKKMRIKHYGIVLLVIWCLFNVYGVWNVPNWYEILVASLMFLPFSIVLFFLSKSTRAQDVGWLRKLDLVGMCVSIVTIIIPLIFFIREVIRYYF